MIGGQAYRRALIEDRMPAARQPSNWATPATEGRRMGRRHRFAVRLDSVTAGIVSGKGAIAAGKPCTLYPDRRGDQPRHLGGPCSTCAAKWLASTHRFTAAAAATWAFLRHPHRCCHGTRTSPRQRQGQPRSPGVVIQEVSKELADSLGLEQADGRGGQCGREPKTGG